MNDNLGRIMAVVFFGGLIILEAKEGFPVIVALVKFFGSIADKL